MIAGKLGGARNNNNKPSDTAGQLKASIHERTGLPADKQRLYHAAARRSTTRPRSSRSA